MEAKYDFRWQTFPSHLVKLFKDLGEEGHFADVTLVSDDQIQNPVHKLVLSACSPVLKTLLVNNPHPHPLLYLRGIKQTELQALLTFMYCGETQIFEKRVDEFMNVANDLELHEINQQLEEEIHEMNEQLQEDEQDFEDEYIKIETKSEELSDKERNNLEGKRTEDQTQKLIDEEHDPEINAAILASLQDTEVADLENEEETKDDNIKMLCSEEKVPTQPTTQNKGKMKGRRLKRFLQAPGTNLSYFELALEVTHRTLQETPVSQLNRINFHRIVKRVNVRSPGFLPVTDNNHLSKVSRTVSRSVSRSVYPHYTDALPTSL